MSEIDDLVASVNKKYKTNIVRKASELKSVEFIPYSSPKMNYLTRGGVPVRRMIELVGLPQSGKTTTTLDVVANFQKKYPDKYCVYLDAENTIDKEWGETLGVDWSKVILIQPESEYGEELLDMLLDYIRSGKIGLAVLDSAPFIVPKAVQEKGLDEKSYGGNSALMNAFCDKVIPLCKKFECTFLMLNQLRENVGNPYKPYKIPCGTAIAHASSQILWFTKGSLLDEKGEEKSSTYSDPVGNVVNVRVEKNKVIIREGDTYEAQVFKEEITIFKNGEELYSIQEKDFKIILKIPGDVRKELTSFATEEEAESFCKENGWEWIDENGFMWDMDYEEVDLC